MQLIDSYNLVDMLIMGTLLVSFILGIWKGFVRSLTASGESGSGSAARVEILPSGSSVLGQNFQARSPDLDDHRHGYHIHFRPDRFYYYPKDIGFPAGPDSIDMARSHSWRNYGDRGRFNNSSGGSAGPSGRRTGLAHSQDIQTCNTG